MSHPHALRSILGITFCLVLAACSEDTTRPRDKADAGENEGDGDDDEDTGDGDSGDGDSLGSDATDAELLAGLVAKMKECKLYQPGDEDETISDEYDRCAVRCILATNCDGLRDVTCSELPDFDAPFYECVKDCPISPKDGYACAGGKKIPHVAVCDGEEDCRDGADESDCEPYVCKDGEELEVGNPVECDGFEDCEDGSDEDGCVDVCE